MTKLDYLNKIYREKGFKETVNEIESLLEYGEVSTESNGLVCITTSGWSYDEALINSLISPLSEFSNHYVGYLLGGAYYFSEKPYYNANVTIISQDMGGLYLLYGVFDTDNQKIIAWCNSLDDAELLVKAKGVNCLRLNEYDVSIRFWRLQKRNCRRRGV